MAGVRWSAALLIGAGLLVTAFPAVLAGRLDQQIGRSEVRVYSSPFSVLRGADLAAMDLPRRLDRLGYRRVHQRPAASGEYFWGRQTFWIFQRAHRSAGRDHPARLTGLELDPNGRVVAAIDSRRSPISRHRDVLLELEGEVLAESLDELRAPREPVTLAQLPESVWRPVLAAEDARFFEHGALDTRSLARAALANLRAGRVVQGGSTITQQLVKNRDLSPRRTLTRKASEAVLALALESEYDKREILEAYLNSVYFGQVEGVAIYGLGRAARTFFSRPAADLSLAEAAALAALIQAPNRLSPVRHPEALRKRRDWVLGRMEELGWASASQVSAARQRGVEPHLTRPRSTAPRAFLRFVRDFLAEHRRGGNRWAGSRIETTLDPLAQAAAVEAVAQGLERLERSRRSLAGSDLSAALVSLDASSGRVLAWVGGDPRRRDGELFDRVRQARRQPGSAIKPLLLLEAFEDCGDRRPLTLASRIADEPLVMEVDGQLWRPKNFDHRFHGVVSLRRALRESYNVPFVRIARWCGLEATARRLRRAGLDLGQAPPPSFSLGAVEVAPLELASAYQVIAAGGRRRDPFPVFRVERSGGKKVFGWRGRSRRVVTASTAWLVHTALLDAVERGTARGAALEGLPAAAKTGTSSDLRDAWLVGHVGRVVTAVWVGRDRGESLGLTGAQAAVPIWKAYMQRAARAWWSGPSQAPRGIVVKQIDPHTGLRVRAWIGRGRPEVFRSRVLPPRKALIGRSPAVEVVR